VITDVAGVRVGHWTDAEAMTGCTVIRFPEGTVASGEVRGGAPAEREFALLEPTRLVQRLDAVVLSGGSAFGLATSDGVMAVLEADGQGYETVGGVVPIVVGLSLYDLGVGDPTIRPGREQGAAAAAHAAAGPYATGAVGAGTGATIAKWRGPEHRRPGGLVTATRRHGDLVVAALVAVNSVGEPGVSAEAVVEAQGATFTNTTIGVVATNAVVDKPGCFCIAQSAHDGLARALAPAHTLADGDAFVAAATGQVEAPLAQVRSLTTAAVEAAILQLA
jgi:L-aminopeptidase/D-esterase-like protein